MTNEERLRPCYNCKTIFRARVRKSKYCSHRCSTDMRAKGYVERFWPNVKKTENCWIWIGGFRDDGYGRFDCIFFKEKAAHRVSYCMANGPIPTGLCVLHRCDNSACVRPDHLFLGTLADNARDMYAKGRNRSRPLIGEENPKAKLTEKDVKEIRSLYTTGEYSCASLARIYPVSIATVHNILTRKIWKHIE